MKHKISEDQIKIDVKQLREQQKELNRLSDKIDSKVLAGLNELFDVIDIIAIENKQKKTITFEMVRR